MSHPIVSAPRQLSLLAVPSTALAYWLSDSLLSLFDRLPRVSSFGYMSWGVSSSNNDRFLRLWWEIERDEREQSQQRWLLHAKGGTYARWYGLVDYLVDWAAEGFKLKQFILERYPYLGDNYEIKIRPYTFDSHGWTYSSMSRGSLGVRILEKHHTTNAKSPALFTQDSALVVGATLNSRPASYILRAIAPALNIDEGYVGVLPVPIFEDGNLLASLVEVCIVLTKKLRAVTVTDRGFHGLVVSGSSLRNAWRAQADTAEPLAALLNACEAFAEGIVFDAYAIDVDDRRHILEETGTPAGWFPLVAGHDTVPDLPSDLAAPAQLFAPLGDHDRRLLSPDALAELKRRLTALYEAGPGATVHEDEDANSTDDEDEGEGDAAVSGARIPIPAETFLEEVSQKLEIHAISVYWLLRELREKDGVICKPELVRFVEDYFSVAVLRLLGHRWPREVEAGEPLPDWADGDGITPLTDGTGEPALVVRVRERIAEDFGEDRVNAIEREFESIIGKSLDAWLTSDFFQRHVSQFRKRPIAWHLTSSRGTGRGRRSTRNAPGFACLVYYHRLNADLIPKLRTQYVGPLRTSFQTELASLGRIAERTADQDARRVELETKVEELDSFDRLLGQVSAEGFASPALDELVVEEPLDHWTSRDGQASAPTTSDALIAQERRYDPDLNDGVRVNIAPLQRAGLLAADVLAARDVEKAIADRATWRAGERRWCREGQLDRPGWWVPLPPRIEVPPMPEPLLSFDPEQDAALFIWAVLHASGGSVPRMQLARAFALRSQPRLLGKFASDDLSPKAHEWGDAVDQRVTPAGTLAKTLVGLASRNGVRNTTDGLSRAIVNLGPSAPREFDLDAWFRFEARLVLSALHNVGTPNLQELAAALAEADRNLLEVA